ncbi:MAG: NAD-dependent epimerase/dehydratase family protein [Deltaproteobacteria bacterium]|nr:NAD-dependent epimerase/dehydratase family protein [Deltaproteobacteria bacterium]
MRVLATGGSGFLGGRVLGLLLSGGHEVVAYSRRDIPGGVAKGSKPFLGELSDPKALREACDGCEAVVHCAGKTGTWGPLAGYLKVNTEGTSNLLKAAKDAGARLFVHTSTPSVVHQAGGLKAADESAPYTGDKGYGYPYSKMLAEKMVLEANRDSFRTLALRPHLIWGPGDPHFLPRILDMAKRGRLRYLSGGPYLVSHTYIDNAAHAHALALRRLAEDDTVAGLAYFIAEPEPMDVKDLVNALLACGGLPPVEREVPRWLARAFGTICGFLWAKLRLKGEPPMTGFTARQLSTSHYFDISRAKTLLGYEPVVGTAEAFERLKEYLSGKSQDKPKDAET